MSMRCHSASFRCIQSTAVQQRFYFRPSAATQFPMKPGTPIPGLDIFKEKDPPVALERSEYPEWIDSLSKPLPSLAKLRKMPEEEATDKDKMRYLKLLRKLKIKKNNEERAAAK